MRTLVDKVVAITGAGSGIGRALAVRAAEGGAIVALSDWDEAGLAETSRLVRTRTGRDVRTDRLDVRDRQAVHDYAGSVRQQLGRVNAVVNNAGVTLLGRFEEVHHDDFQWVMDVDFWGVVHGTEAFLPHLVASGDGHVVNISSLFGLMSMPGQTAYNSAKFAVRGFTEALRLEMLVDRRPVQVTCVHPGGVRTRIVRDARATASTDQPETARHFDDRLARTTPERAAEIIVAGMLAHRPRVLVGNDAKVLDKVVRLTGPRYQRVLALLSRRHA
jgi:NAD(P)-dependent dehydrogenase (short-subunit alcohol dehydrogenase family)